MARPQVRTLSTQNADAYQQKHKPTTLVAAMQRVFFGLAFGLAVLPQVSQAQSTNADTNSDEARLPTVNVTSNKVHHPADLPPPYAGGQVAKGARLGLLGNQDVMDMPFNVTSYTNETIQNQQARTIADVVANDPSVRNTTSSGHMYENFRIRGFDVNASEMAINGMFGVSPIGHVPLEFIERVEVLKGPSALFSGMPPGGGVGGVVNLVPKRAENDPLTRVSVGFQSEGQAGATIDLGRRFGEHKEWGVRVNSAHSDGDTELNGQSKKREFLSAALDYRSRDLTASLDAYHSKEAFNGGTPAMYWFQGGIPIPAARDPKTNLFPGTNGSLESNGVVARAEYAFNKNLSAFAGVGVMNFDSAGFINGTHARNIAANGNFSAIVNNTRSYTDSVAAEAGLRSKFATDNVLHEMVLHASNLEQENGSATNFASSVTSNIYKPATSLTMPATPAYAPKTSETTLSSVALVDTMSMLNDTVRLTLGLRNQTVKSKNFSTSGAVTSSYDKSAVTPAAAVVVKPWGPNLSLYANYVQGLSQGSTVTDTAATNYQHVFAPYKTEQKEIGAKWNAGTFTHTASLFEITKPSLVALGSSVNPTYSDEGEKRVRGLEWNTFGEISRGVRVLGGLTYGKGEQTRSAYGKYDGKEAIASPRWQGNLGAEWDTPWMAGLTLSGRVNATSSQFLDAANAQQIPSWTTVDVGARYTTRVDGKKLILRLSVNNLFNRQYWSGSFSDNYAMATLGAPRTVTASASMDF
ncbi:MAG: ferrichrome-iron receptor [Burkholderiaceae bacterium]|nr:ferrichrome-iron receptor [Burkholderiaceae bacterium]